MEELVADEHVDASIQRMNSDGSPLVSSGVSSEGSRKSQPTGESPAGPSSEGSTAPSYPCPHLKCKSVLKTYNGFQNHTYLHSIADANLKKPNMEFILSSIPAFVSEVFEEILVEPNLPDEKKEVVNKIIASVSEGSANSLWFCETVSNIISTPILLRTKLLPSNQYEEVLSSVNHSLNNEETFEDLRLKACFLIPEIYHSSKYLRNVLFRLLFRVCELVQIQVLQEMKESQDNLVDPGAVVGIQNKEEEELLKRRCEDFLKFITQRHSLFVLLFGLQGVCVCGESFSTVEIMIL